MEITAANLDILFRTVSSQFQSTLLNTPTFWNQIAMEMPMTSQQATLAFLDRVPVMRKWIGPRTIQSAIARSRTVNAERYEQTLALDETVVSDDQIGLFMLGVQMQAEAGAKLQDQLISQFIESQAATVLGYDGVPVYSTAHPTNGGTDGVPLPAGAPATQSNLLVSTALTYANYQTARETFRSWVGVDGTPLGGNPDLLMVPPQLEGTAKLILESDFLAQTAFGASSNSPATNVWKNSAKILVNPWLANMPNNWWLFDTSKGVKPFVYHNRQAVRMRALASPTDPNVFMDGQMLWGIDARSAVSESVWFLQLAGTSEAAYYPA